MTWAAWVDARVTAVRDRIPPAFAGVALDHPDVQAWCSHVLDGKAGALVLLGSVGSGKTATAWATWLHLVGAGWVGAWDAVTERAWLDLHLPGGDLWRASRLEAADVLLLDDVGASAPTDWSRSRVFGLLDARWTQGLPTILTTNLTTRALGEHLGERAASRLGQNLTTVTLTGPDRRLT